MLQNDERLTHLKIWLISTKNPCFSLELSRRFGFYIKAKNGDLQGLFF